MTPFAEIPTFDHRVRVTQERSRWLSTENRIYELALLFVLVMGASTLRVFLTYLERPALGVIVFATALVPTLAVSAGLFKRHALARVGALVIGTVSLMLLARSGFRAISAGSVPFFQAIALVLLGRGLHALAHGGHVFSEAYQHVVRKTGGLAPTSFRRAGVFVLPLAGLLAAPGVLIAAWWFSRYGFQTAG